MVRGPKSFFWSCRGEGEGGGYLSRVLGFCGPVRDLEHPRYYNPDCQYKGEYPHSEQSHPVLGPSVPQASPHAPKTLNPPTPSKS